MIYVEEKLKIKDSLIHFTKNDLYYMFYDKSFDEYNYSINNSIKDKELRKEDLKEDYFLEFKDILKIKEDLKEKTSNEKDDMINKFMYNYNYKNIFENKNIEEIEILNIKNNNVNESLAVRECKEELHITEIENTDFKDLEEEIKKNEFTKCFNDFGFCKNEKDESFIYLNSNNYTLILTKESLINKLDKYAENEIRFIPPVEPQEGELADDYKEYIQQQQSYELEF